MISNFHNIRRGALFAGSVSAAAAASSAVYSTMSSNKGRSGDGMTMDYGQSAFQPNTGLNVGSKISATQCRTKTGRYKKQNYKGIVEALCYKYKYQYQSLIGTAAEDDSFRVNGLFDLRSRYLVGIPNTVPQRLALPIYCFRLNVPMCAYQSNLPSAGSNALVAPIIGFRLVAAKGATESTYTYKWEKVDVNQGLNPTNPNFGTGWVTYRDSDLLMATNKHRFDGCRAEILYTAPTTVPSSLTVSVVRFTRDSYAPPDEYYSGSTIENLRPNSGAWDIAIPVPPDEPDRLDATAFWTQFVHNRDGHPLARMSLPYSRRLFTTEASKTIDFSPGDTTNKLTTGLQHKHITSVKGGVWHTVSIEDKSISVPANNLNQDLTYQIPASTYDNKTIGLFPEPTQQKWLMVSSFTRQGYDLNGVAFNPLVHPSFDIRINNAFTSAETFTV